MQTKGVTDSADSLLTHKNGRPCDSSGQGTCENVNSRFESSS